MVAIDVVGQEYLKLETPRVTGFVAVRTRFCRRLTTKKVLLSAS